jgi:hypothetical protein
MTCRQIQRLLILLIALLLIESGILRAQDLSVAMNGNGEWVSRYEPLEFTLSRPVSVGEHITLIIGTTDVTNLCTTHNDTLSYNPQAVPLPSGSVNVSVYLVTTDGTWTSVGSYTLNVLTSTGLEKTLVTPSITLSNKGQLAEDHFPDANAPARRKFQELNGQMALKVDFERSGVSVGLGFNTVGVSFRQEALRFGEKREDASKIDLASYLIETRTGRTTLSAGHISHGRQRHLLSGFSSRGISAATAIGTFADLSGAVLTGTNIVGWDNFLGLHNPKHRLYSGTLGLEILPQDPGTVRIEASYVHGSQLPLNNFNQAQVNDAEESNGGSVRLLLSDPGKNITVDAGFTKTRFTNPVDPLLAQGIDIVPVEATTRQARYADVTWDVFRNATLLDILPARLNVAFRHERVDPLYRAVGASTRADNLQNTYELHGGVGPVQLDLTHLQSEDNLAEIPSVLKSKTRQTGANVVLSPSSAPDMLPPWLPTFSYGLNSTHQFGVSTPTNSDFTPDRVPDQVTTTHMAGIEWQGSSLRLGYRGTFTMQDNRQPGRENTDIVNRTNGLNISFSPVTGVSMNLEGSLESIENTGTGGILRTNRVGASFLAPLPAGATASLNASLSITQPDDGSSSQRQALFSLETSYAFDLSSSFVFSWRGQVFARYSWSESKSRDNVFNLDTQTRAWVVNTGISFNLF